MALSDYAGQGWIEASPPELDAGATTVAEVDGEPIKAGFERQDSPIEESDTCVHRKFRSGKYDVEVKVVSGDGEIAISGYVRVEEAEGYE